MSQSSSNVFVKAERPPLSFDDYRRICKVKWTHKATLKPDWVVLGAQDYETEHLPSGLEGCHDGDLLIQGEWFRQMTDDGKKSFQDGDLVNVAWSLPTGRMTWAAPRHPGPNFGQNNEGFW